MSDALGTILADVLPGPPGPFADSGANWAVIAVAAGAIFLAVVAIVRRRRKPKP